MAQSFHFQVDPKLASLLGENYRSTESALKELVDNAWDADANSVYITLPSPMTSDPITVEDDGTGMTSKEVQNEYLVIANDRKTRKGERTQQKNRVVKGRKGIGKFAGLMAADQMDIETNARGITTRLRIKKEDLLSSHSDLEKVDLPIETISCDENVHGTAVTLSNLNQGLAFPSSEKLKQILVLEYGRQEGFIMFVNGEMLGIDDIPGESFDEEIELEGIGKARLRYTIAEGNKPLKQSGIAIRVKGKIVGKTTYFGLEQHEYIPEKLFKRVYGEVEVDGLVDDVTADWGAIIENSIGFQTLSKWAGIELSEKVEKVFDREVKLARARLKRQIYQRLENLPEYRRDFAQKALDRVLEKFYGENSERQSVIVSVMLDAFERDEYWVVIKEINDAKNQDVETFAEALGNFGLLDMALMAQHTSKRLLILDEIESLIGKPETLEKTMHTVIERNSRWILGAEYSLMSSNKTLAKVIEEYSAEKFKGKRANKRPDLFLCNDLYDNHLLVEFKRPSHSINRDDENQAEKYRDDLTPKFGKIEIMLIGKEKDVSLSAHYDRKDIKVLSYSGLISKARLQLNWLIQQLTENRQAV